MSMSFDPVSYLMGQKSAGGGGGGSDVFIVNLDTVTNTLDQTWQTIHDAFVANKIVIIAEHYDYGEEGQSDGRVMVNQVSTENGYSVATSSDWYTAETADDYPVGS